jgi:putative restriction endonuclease
LHQASFRDAVLAACGGRCAISHLPEPRLLDAAHIIMDADEQLGQPIVSNDLPLSKIHHAARPPATSRRENKKSAYSK